MGLEFQGAPVSLGSLVKTQAARSQTQNFDSVGLGCGLNICISTKLPSDIDAARWGVQNLRTIDLKEAFLSLERHISKEDIGILKHMDKVKETRRSNMILGKTKVKEGGEVRNLELPKWLWKKKWGWT